MIFVIGGFSQGKLSYTLKTFGCTGGDVFSGDSDSLDGLFDKSVINNFHSIAKRMYYLGENPIELVTSNIDKFKDKIIISCEVGCGIVPVDKRERELREIIGKINCIFAENADRVDRVFCMIGQRIK